MDQGSRRSGDRFQVRLWDLIVLVVGASYVLDVARRSKVAWGGGLPDLAHAIGLTVLTLGLCVGLVVVSQWVRQFKRREVRAWAVLWRLIVVVWLTGSLIETAAALQVANKTGAMPPFGDQATMRLRVTTLMTALGMVGLMLAVAPLRSRPVGPRPRWGSWPSVILAALVGIVFLGLAHGFIPYLVLIAIEAVQNALPRGPLVPRPILFDRLVTASLEALPGLLGCLATAIWVDDDLRAAVRDPLEARAPRSWWGMMARVTTVALAASGSAYVVLVSIPTLSPSLAEGIAATVAPSSMATIALGFATLAAGISARSTAHLATGSTDQPTDPEPTVRLIGIWPRRVIVGIIGLVCAEIAAAAIQAIRRDLDYHWYIPIGLDAWGAIFQVPLRWFGQPSSSNGWFVLFEGPDGFLIGVAAAWLTIRLIGLILPKGSAGPSPLDTIVDDRRLLGRFLGWWIGLATLMLASLPGLAIVGITLIHFVVRWVSR